MSELSASAHVALEGAAGELAAPVPTTIAMTTSALETSAATGGAESRRRRGAVVARLLVVADAIAVAGAGAVAALVGSDTAPQSATVAVVLAGAPVFFVGMGVRGLYTRDAQRPNHSTVDEAGDVVQIAVAAAWAGILAMWLATGRVSAAPAVAFWLASVAFTLVARCLARSAARRDPLYVQSAVIVGAGNVGQLVARKLLQHPEFGIRLAGFVDGDPRERRPGVENVPVLGAPADLAEIVRTHDVDRVIVAFSNEPHDVLLEHLRSVRSERVQLDVVPRLFEAVDPVSSLNLIEGFPLLSVRPTEPSRLALQAKRLGDVALASMLLFLTLPFFAWIAWRIKRDSPGPVFFRQTRLGEQQKPFTLLKFRTMRVDADAETHREYVRGIMDVGAAPAANNLYKLDRASDVTRVGAWLRRTSLDELPQLINVIRGEMSLVGPRPCIAYETELFEPHHFDRFLVPAGMTGLWQVAARARATFKEALDLDAAYARSWSLGLDASLLLRTPRALLRDKATT
jgi:exopolysaccharide biosynthesis polyprenyl glycosylphosphotransferase